MRLELTLLAQRLAVCRRSPEEELPLGLLAEPFCAVVRTGAELSLVLPEERLPPAWPAERGFRALEVAGPLDFSLTGVMASLAAPLASAGVPLFTLSTHDTDYLLVRESDLERARRALARAGHRLR